MEKRDVFLDLLQDIHRICEENGLSYVLHGKPAINAYLNGTIRGTGKVIEVAMTRGDAERFKKCVQKMLDSGELTDRYIECTENNPKFKGNYIMFGDLSTVYVTNKEWNVTKSTHIIHNCIHINIRYIDKVPVSDSKKTGKKHLLGKRWRKRLDKLENMEFVGWNLWYARIGALAYNLLLRIRYGKNYRLRKYLEKVDKVSVDNWESLNETPEVRIGKHKFPCEIFESIKTVELDSIKVNVLEKFDEYAALIYGDEWENRKESSMPEFFSAYMSYDEFSNHPEIQKQIHLIKKNREKLFDIRKNAFFLRRKIITVKKIVMMSKDKIDYTEQYLGMKDYIMNLSFENDYDELKEIFTPLMRSIKSFEKRGITYSVDPEIDAILYKIMIKEGYVKKVNHIQKLKEKKYFI